MQCFRIDESGYTGHDLLNSDQRFQGAAAIAIDNADARRLIKEHFPRLQADELKYRSISRRSTYRAPLRELHKILLTDFKCVTSVCDKGYLLTLMFLNYAVEPFYYEGGFDFYEDGQNYAIASLLYQAGPTILGENELATLFSVFQRAVKIKTRQSLRDLVAAARRTRWHKLPEVLGPLAKCAAPECLDAIATPSVNTDAIPVVLQSLISRTETIATGPYRIEHDESKNLLAYHDYFLRLIEHEEKVEFRTNTETTLKFPLNLTEVKYVNSRMSPAVQLADILIGVAIDAANHLAGFRSGGLDPDQVFSIYQDQQLVCLAPDLDLEAQRRFREGTQSSELIDYFAKNFSRRP